MIVATITDAYQQPSRLAFVAPLGISVFVFAASLYIPALRLDERAEALKRNYIALDELLYQFQMVDDSDSPQLSKLIARYNSLLMEVENHHAIDYLLALREAKGESMSFSQQLKLLATQVGTMGALFLALGLPVALEAWLLYL